MLRTDGTDGGPAFPQTEWCYRRGDGEGMSLRDWFAGQADVSSALGFLHREGCEELIGRKMPEDLLGMLLWQFDVVARLKHMAADAMLAAREAGQ